MTEPTIWRYVVPPGKHDNWHDFGGVFVVGSDGYFSCVTDYGNYAFRWSAFTGDFRRFLLGCEKYYLRGKLCTHRVWDSGAVEAHMREVIARCRERTGNEAADELLENISSHCESAVALHDWFREQDELDHDDVFESFPSETYPGDLIAMTERLWPRFRKLLQADLRERQPRTSDLRSVPAEQHKRVWEAINDLVAATRGSTTESARQRAAIKVEDALEDYAPAYATYLVDEVKQLRHDNSLMRAARLDDEVWFWQDDEDDDLESLAEDTVVKITAGTFRRVLTSAKEASK